MSIAECFKSRERTCPVCNKVFLLPVQNTYKLKKRIKGKEQTVDYCSYTCWRKAGGDRK